MLRLEVAVGSQGFDDMVNKIGHDNIEKIYILNYWIRSLEERAFLFICREHDQLPSGQEPEHGTSGK